jgi:hypothetical protein
MSAISAIELKRNVCENLSKNVDPPKFLGTMFPGWFRYFFYLYISTVGHPIDIFRLTCMPSYIHCCDNVSIKRIGGNQVFKLYMWVICMNMQHCYHRSMTKGSRNIVIKHENDIVVILHQGSN